MELMKRSRVSKIPDPVPVELVTVRQRLAFEAALKERKFNRRRAHRNMNVSGNAHKIGHKGRSPNHLQPGSKDRWKKLGENPYSKAVDRHWQMLT